MSATDHDDIILGELYKQLRKAWQQDFRDQLAKIAVELLQGRIPVGALPPGTMVDRGSHIDTTRYRPGDVVVDGGTTYVAIQANVGVATSDTAYWRPFGGGGGVGPPDDTFVYLVDDDGAYLVDDDGAYLWESA